LKEHCESLCDRIHGLVEVDSGAARLGIKVAYSMSWNGEHGKEELLDEEVEALIEEVKGMFTLEGLKLNPVIRAYRDFYWRIGIDPTKIRPSSEALLRRLLRGKWPRINPVVDAGNIASARHLVPIGLYDTRFFEPPATIKLSNGSELFEPIGGKPEVIRKGLPIMVDSKGDVMHLYPHRDSRKTMIRDDTRCILVLAAGVPGVEEERLINAVKEVQRLLDKMGWKRCNRIAAAPAE